MYTGFTGLSPFEKHTIQTLTNMSPGPYMLMNSAEVATGRCGGFRHRISGPGEAEAKATANRMPESAVIDTDWVRKRYEGRCVGASSLTSYNWFHRALRRYGYSPPFLTEGAHPAVGMFPRNRTLAKSRTSPSSRNNHKDLNRERPLPFAWVRPLIDHGEEIYHSPDNE